MKNLLLFLILLPNIIFSQQHTISSFSPSNAHQGEIVRIVGTNFSSITAVRFGGVDSPSFTVVSPTIITATVPSTTSGNITIIKTGFSNATRTGFNYSSIPTITSISTDFGGFWLTNTTTNNSTTPDNSHDLLSFTYKGITYSTGVDDSKLTTNSITFTPGNFKALPVSFNGLTNDLLSSDPNLLVAASRVDGNLTSAIVTHANIKDLTIQDAVLDGVRGLNLGTGYTNLPTTASAKYSISILVDSLISDDEPDLLITQIADPSTNTDTYTFVDANNNTIGTSLTFSMNPVSALGTYRLDLFRIPAGQPFDVGKPNLVHTTNTTRQIRFVALRLSDFGINQTNYHLVKGLRINPSGTSDVAFIGYNANAIKALPVITRKNTTDTLVCEYNDTATLSVNVTSSYGDILTYQWQKKVNNIWVNLTPTTKYLNPNTTTLKIVYGDSMINFNNEIYRIKVVSENSEDSTYSTEFKVNLLNTSCFLPVELLYFNGECTEEGNILRWATASEYNSLYFDVERTRDGETWLTIGTINSAGFSNNKIDYELLDSTKNNTIEYYRLKQVDINGDYKIYNPIVVSCDDKFNNFLTYPNPSDKKFTLLIGNQFSTYNLTVKMINSAGLVVLSKEIEVKPGTNSYEIEHELTIGLYYILIGDKIIKHIVRNR